MNIKDIPDDDTGQAIKRWAKEGTDLTQPINIDFFVAVDNEFLGQKIAAELMGFSTSVEKDDETGEWTCYCTKTMIPDYTAVLHVESMLQNIADKFGASYEGFGSFGN